MSYNTTPSQAPSVSYTTQFNPLNNKYEVQVNIGYDAPPPPIKTNLTTLSVSALRPSEVNKFTTQQLSCIGTNFTPRCEDLSWRKQTTPAHCESILNSGAIPPFSLPTINPLALDIQKIIEGLQALQKKCFV